MAARQLAAVVAVVLTVASCGSAPLGGELDAETARIELGDQRLVVDLDACGQDDDLVFLVGQRAGIVLQAIVDLGDGGEARSGISVDLAPDEGVGAFGLDAAAVLGADLDRPVGEVTRISVSGDRVLVEADVETLGPGLRPEGDDRGRLLVVARCPEEVVA